MPSARQKNGRERQLNPRRLRAGNGVRERRVPECSWTEETDVVVSEPLFVVVSRKAIAELDLSEPLSVLRHLISSPAVARDYCERVDIAFEGYDRDNRDLWEIPEVRDFVHRLDEEFPYWLFFLNRRGRGLYALARCFLLPHLTPKGEQEHNRPRLAGLFTRRWLPALNHLAAVTGLSETEIARLSESAVNYFVGSPNDAANPVSQLIEYAAADGRICPNPREWAALHEMLR